MDWKDEIIEGMKLIEKGCKKAYKDTNKCDECPFGGYCNAIILNYYYAPFSWRIKNEDN